MRLCAITDRRMYPGGDCTAALLEQAGRWASAGVEFIQVREKDMSFPRLGELVSRLVEGVRRAQREPGLSESPLRTRVLVNGAGATQLAREAGADGIHLPGADAFSGALELSEQVQAIRQAWPGPPAIVSVSCHSIEEAHRAGRAGTSFVVFSPIFEKPLWGHGSHGRPLGSLPGLGLSLLSAACFAAGRVPVYALGGVTPGNASACVEAGAAGVAGVRLFAEEGWAGLVSV